VSGSSISWAICKSAPRSRQITTPAPHHSVFLQAGCNSCRPTNSVKALKARLCSPLIAGKTGKQNEISVVIVEGLMAKPKRKLIASACLILSAKLNDVKGAELSRLIQVSFQSYSSVVYKCRLTNYEQLC